MKNLLQKGIFWIFTFGFIFLATQDYFWAPNVTKISFWGFPSWLFYFMSIHLLFVGAFYFFIKKYWTE